MDVEEILDRAGVPPLTPEFEARVRTLTELQLHEWIVEALCAHQRALLALAYRLHARCGLCAVRQRDCELCQSDGKIIRGVQSTMIAFARVASAACKPGSRIAAQREARDERLSG